MEKIYGDGRGNIPSSLNSGRHVSLSIGICNNSYYSFLNFKYFNTVMGVTPKYNTE